MNDDPSTTVRKLLIAGQGLPEAKVTPDARILHDLSVDGDDAGDLFQAVHERFGTDFTELTYQWRVFFNTEGASPRAILFGIAMINREDTHADAIVDSEPLRGSLACASAAR